MQAVILAAGKGTRLKHLTSNRSKAMMPIAGQPMIGRVLQMLKSAGLDEFIVVAHPEDEALKGYLAGQPGIQIAFQAERKGAAHALGMAAGLIRSDFVLTACDNLVEEPEAREFINAFKKAPRPAGLLALMKVPPEAVQSMGMVDFDGTFVRRIVEKPAPGSVASDIASMPLYCFQLRFLDYLPRLTPTRRGEYELQDAMQMMIDECGDMRGRMLSGRKTLTDARDLLDLNLHYLAENATTPAGLDGSIRLNPPFLIEPGAVLDADCVIGPGVVVESNAQVGRGAILRNALVLTGAQVAPGQIVENQVIG